MLLSNKNPVNVMNESILKKLKISKGALTQTLQICALCRKRLRQNSKTEQAIFVRRDLKGKR